MRPFFVRTPARVLAVPVLLGALAVLPLACDDDDDVTDPGPPPAQITVSMRDNFFQRRVDTVAVGGTVAWRNDGAIAHTSTSDTNLWDSGAVNSGATFARQFTQAGSFPYFCAFHGQAGGVGMAGTLVVR
jgi:plastocyanin